MASIARNSLGARRLAGWRRWNGKKLDRAPAAKAIAQVGAVIAREISYELLTGLNLMSEDALGAALEQLTASRLATCSGVIPRATYKFSHMLLQDAAYDSLLKSRRRTLHADVARLLSQQRPEMTVTTPELLAYHYTRAEQHKIAAPLWLKGGEPALRRSPCRRPCRICALDLQRWKRCAHRKGATVSNIQYAACLVPRLSPNVAEPIQRSRTPSSLRCGWPGRSKAAKPISRYSARSRSTPCPQVSFRPRCAGPTKCSGPGRNAGMGI